MILQPGEPLSVGLALSPADTFGVGRLAMDGNRAAFEYREAFIASGRRIHPTWPAPAGGVIRAKSPRDFKGLHGIFADSLPDAWGTLIMKRLLSGRGTDYMSLNGLDRLALVGRSGAGALAYRPDYSEHDDDEIDFDALALGAAAVLEGAPTNVVEALASIGGSPGGARPKVFVARNAEGRTIPGSGEIPDGYEGWIVKFRGGTDDADIGPLEAAYADMARAAGLDVAPTAIVPSSRSEYGYFATRRFDRGPDGARAHVVSVAAVLDVNWAEPSIDYTSLISLVNGITRDHSAAESMFRRMTFNVFACNRDDHTKQHAFIQASDGSWRLAPAYDLTLSGGPGNQHYLAVNGKGNGIGVDDVLAVAKAVSIPPSRARAIADEVRSAVALFPTFADRYGVSDLTRASFANMTALNPAVVRTRSRSGPAMRF